MDNIRFEYLSESNLDKLRDCFNRCRKRRLPLKFFKEKYTTQWSGIPLLGVIARDKNVPIALGCTTLYKFKDLLCNYIVAQCGDLVVDERYRRQGIATQMMHILEEEAEKKDIDAIVIFPNSNAQNVYEKLPQWKKIGFFASVSIKVNTIPVLKLFNKIKLHSIYFKLLQQQNKTLTAIKNDEIVKNSKIGVSVDNDYLNYKKYGHYSLLTYNNKTIIWTFSDGLVVLFSEVMTENELKLEIQHLKAFCRKRGIHEISYYCYSGSNLFTLLSKEYEVVPTLPVYAYQINPKIDLSKIVFNGIDRNAFDL